MNIESFRILVKTAVERIEKRDFSRVRSLAVLNHMFDEARIDLSSVLAWKLHFPKETEQLIPWAANSIQAMLNELREDYELTTAKLEGRIKEIRE